jgi:hypothetical protein
MPTKSTMRCMKRRKECRGLGCHFIEELIFDFFRWNKGSNKSSSSLASVASSVVASTT